MRIDVSAAHSYNVRICHWINLVACVYLLWSGVHIFLDFKNLKFLKSIRVVDSMAGIGRGTGGINSDFGFHWFAGV
jgi:cytochrome b subunit of formate dehydrogenase